MRRGLEGPESVAAHAWGVALLVLAYLPEGLDLGKALAYAILHDLPEAVVGDWTPHDAPPDKHAAEAAAMASLATGLPRGASLEALWRAYEAQADPESRFVRQLDGLDMALTATRYAARGLDPAEFHASAAGRIADDPLGAVLAALAAGRGR